MLVGGRQNDISMHYVPHTTACQNVRKGRVRNTGMSFHRVATDRGN